LVELARNRAAVRAFAIHFVLAHWSVYERPTFRPPPLELLRTALTSPCRSC
jgi:hypothetical protein